MMMNLDYAKEIHRLCPQFFKIFIELEERRYENINIGGLKEGIWLTHIANIYLPYINNGEYTMIQFGLSAELPVDALMGVNVQQKMKMTINLGTNQVTSLVLNNSYKLRWARPENKSLETISK